MILVAYWSLTYGIQLLYTDLEAQLFWSNVQYVGAVTPVAFFVFVLYYTGREHLVTPGRVAAAAALPLSTAVAVWVPGLVDLVRADVEFVDAGTFVLTDVTVGPLFMAMLVYDYLFIFAGIGLLVLRTFNTSAVYRYQSLLITVGAVVPVSGSVASYLLGVTQVDLTPVGLSVFGLTVVVALTRFRLLDASPVARDRVIEEVNDGILVTDTNGRVVDINPAARRILDLEEGIGTVLSAVDSPHAASLTEMAAGTKTELVVSGETDRYYQCRKTTNTDASGRQQVNVYILHEVTERRAREEWFRSLTEYSSDVVCVLDADLCLRYVSPSVERVLGYEPDALEGDSLLEYVHDEDAAEVREVLRTETDEPVRLTYRARTADGDWRTLESRSQHRLDDPVVEGIVVNVRDVTEIQARKRELQRKNERLDAFASVVSHDLRNPLNVAAGRTALLEGSLPEGSEHAEHVDALERSLDRMEGIIDDTLTLARQGYDSVEPRPIEVGNWTRRAWAMVDTAEATLDVAADLTVRGDPDHLQQLFENLFRNAVEHGGDAVTVRVGPLGEEGIYVEDDGPGIPPEDRERLFEPGESSAGGIGFGLPIVERIADAHGWDVTITDGRSGGARFEFTGVEVLSSDYPEPDAVDEHRTGES